jgi:glutamate---cysteine ligase / carboxylate-amine ligase
MTDARLGLFEAYGIELELMIVDAQTLDVRPICDQLLTAAAGELTGEVEFGAISWSNELALHVIEFKVSEPVSDLDTIGSCFQKNIGRARELLTTFNARLMPAAMHPWMDPKTEMRLWPHDYSPVYGAFDRIFNCSGHGWANLQSTHWNLPFADDDQFARLHAAIRVLLPLIPVLTASSPIYDGSAQGWLDCRLDVYRRNSQRIPSIAGKVIPEGVYSQAAYDEQIYQVMYRDIGPLDPEGILQHVWLNARGAIARFDRGAIEIRTLDCQECPAADVALGRCMVQALRQLVAERWSSYEMQAAADTEMLAQVLWAVARKGRQAEVPLEVARLFGRQRAMRAGELWRGLVEDMEGELPGECRRIVSFVLEQGSLAERLLRAVDGDTSRRRLKEVYGVLCDCLDEGKLFGI